MFVEFFIRRPVFATVCALITVLVGAVSIPGLAVARYPEIALPQVVVTAVYTGASSDVVESAVTVPLEQAINGVEGMKYITSSSTSDGVATITVTFDLSRNVDLAAVDVQNRVAAATGRLPAAVKQTGVTVTKSSGSFVMAIGLYPKHDEYDSLFISNYADRYLKDALKRIPGVGDVRIFGERKYSMRVWLDPDKLAARKLTASDVVRALQEQNVEVAAGQIGQAPSPPGQAYQVSVRASGRLRDAAEFDRLILRAGSDGNLVELHDVGHAELGAEDYGTILRFDGKSTVGMGVLQLPGANALDVDTACKAEMARLAKSFPPGLEYTIAFDPTDSVRDSIDEVLVTLAEAVALVIAVIFVFLGTWRSTLIPAITIPVSLVGTFAFVNLFGFSINTLTLFGLTLATGLVVDDAIVVIENIERYIQEKGFAPRAAASHAMGEVFGAVIATSLVLIAVFVPVAFFPGISGRVYKQFSLTIAFSIALSAFNAVTLTPALSALLLRKHSTQSGFAAKVDHLVERARTGYGHALAHLLQWRRAALLGFAALLALTWFVFKSVPTGFVPPEDQGYLIISVQAPEGSSLEYTKGILEQAEEVIRAQPETLHMFAIGGFGFAGSGATRGTIFINLKDFSERKGAEHGAPAVVDRLRGALGKITGAIVVPFLPPTIQGVGNLGGFQFEVLDQGGSTPQALAAATWAVAGRGNQRPDLRGLFSGFTANDPQFVVDVDRERAKALGVSLDEIFGALGVYLGSSYVNDFDYADRSYRVYVQADPKFRGNPKVIEDMYVRTARGEMVPLGGLVTVKSGVAPQVITHYDLFRSAEINGSAAPGKSTGQAIATMEEIAGQTLPSGMSFAWTGLSLEEIESGSKAPYIFALGLVFVFLVLAAQYESFSLPFIVLLGVPLAVLGALGAQWLRGLSNDVFCQVGLVMLIGLASKNAILIVEFAEQLRHKGMPMIEAAIEASKTRLRPILMTSFAFILGVLPLTFASGAGQASRHSLGTAVLGGMLVSTLLNLFVIPVLYVVVESLRERAMRRRAHADEPAPAS